MRDSLMSVGPIADNRERLESYDNRLDADGGGAQYRNQRLYSSSSDGDGKERTGTNVYDEIKVENQKDRVEEEAQQKRLEKE